MAKTKEKEVLEEVKEETKTEETPTEDTKDQPKESTLYYFYSVGCGFCKKVEPIVDELIKEGHDILKLDLAEPDNRGLKDEISKKYNKQCGTPWFIDAETGNQVCGYREKEDIEKWVNGEDIPAPPRPKSPPPRPPFEGVPDEEVEKWKEDYQKWLDENSHLPNTQTAEQILSRPRPKSEPPRPPQPNSTDKQLNEWKDEYDKWAKENDHLPNLQKGDDIVQRIKSQKQQMQQNNSPAGTAGLKPDELARLTRLEQKVDKLIRHLGVK